jgi:hypothetical protein
MNQTTVPHIPRYSQGMLDCLGYWRLRTIQLAIPRNPQNILTVTGKLYL